jgi:thiol-disulfide isomerase/thioredoxin
MRWLPLLLLLWLAMPAGIAGADTPEDPWITHTEAGEPRIHLYFFWTPACPHCRAAKPFIEQLRADYPWLVLHSFDVQSDLPGRLRYQRLAASLGESAAAVPAFLFCRTLLTGYDDANGVGRQLRTALEDCQRRLVATGRLEPVAASTSLTVPLFGDLDVQQLSLPLLTVVLAGLDAFNPCAFFVLLFLLSLLVHARRRRQMLLIGGVFIVCSGLIYFVFMAAWLNAFLLLGSLPFITAGAGSVAVVMGTLNVKDYFLFHQGPSLSIPDSAKPGLFRRMRRLAVGDHLPSLLLGTVTLAVAANSYELLCTAGFPLVYTRTLTLNGLSAGNYYLYLLLYNLIYIVPLLIILLGFVYTLGSRKLQEREGRLLKLLSGNMMLGLGLLLLIHPEGLNSVGTALAVLVAALGFTALAAALERRRSGRLP